MTNLLNDVSDFTSAPIDKNKLEDELVKTSHYHELLLEASINAKRNLVIKEKEYNDAYGKLYVELKSDQKNKRTEAQADAEVKLDLQVNSLANSVLLMKNDFYTLEVWQRILTDRLSAIRGLIELVKLGYYHAV